MTVTHTYHRVLSKALICLSMIFCSGSALAEQMQVIGQAEVHYIVLPTTFLRPEIAAQYQIPRGKDRALVNVSVLGADGNPQQAHISGTSRNLLGQIQTLNFRLVTEQNAVYYLALLTHADEEHHRIELNVTLSDGNSGDINFQQKMYWKH